jgi:oxygen-independent coproporphyrinogen-3 oxidase
VEDPYITSLIKEWDLYRELVFKSHSPKIKELHFGGGTPTFFHPDKLILLLEHLFQAKSVDPDECELSFEAHPGNTTYAHLDQLYRFGFRRLSLGIQDYNEVVQKAINRIQSFEEVRSVHNSARDMGYTSISHDLVFGLPKQTMEHMMHTIDLTLELKPDRISLYSYAHVPWVKGVGQRGFSESDLPKDEDKRALYEAAKSRLEDAGYLEIGMDHFALPHDSMAIALSKKELHRNFMGYTTQYTDLLLGLGMSAISDSWFAFAQNEKHVEDYQARVERGELPVFRGHLLSDEDLEIRKCILDLMCHFETDLNGISDVEVQNEIKSQLAELISDVLVYFDGSKLIVTPEGVPFVRNVCMAFDRYIQTATSRTNLFSKTI